MVGAVLRSIFTYSHLVAATSPDIPTAVNLSVWLAANLREQVHSGGEVTCARSSPPIYTPIRPTGPSFALTGLGVTLAVAVPDRWAGGDGTTRTTDSGDDSGVQIIPIPVRGPLAEPDRLRWNAKALRRLLADFHPELLHIEEEPWTQPAALGIRLARRLGIKSALSTGESLPRTFTIAQSLRRERTLRLATGLIGSNRLALALATKRRATAPQLTLPRLGVTPPLAVPREPHPGLSIGFVGRLVPERGLDLLFRACVGLAGSGASRSSAADRLRRSWRRWPSGSASPRGSPGSGDFPERRWMLCGPGSIASSSPLAPPSAGWRRKAGRRCMPWRTA